MFTDCIEFRFFIFDGIIKGIYWVELRFMKLEWINVEEKTIKVNKTLLDFVNKIIEKTEKLWGRQAFLRIDVYAQCPKRTDKDASKGILQLFKSEKDIIEIPDHGENFNIYLNEIEHMGSGLKMNAYGLDEGIIDFKKQKPQLDYQGNGVQDKRIYDYYREALMKQINETHRGGNKHKYYKYKTKYFNLLHSMYYM